MTGRCNDMNDDKDDDDVIDEASNDEQMVVSSSPLAFTIRETCSDRIVPEVRNRNNNDNLYRIPSLGASRVGSLLLVLLVLLRESTRYVIDGE